MACHTRCVTDQASPIHARIVPLDEAKLRLPVTADRDEAVVQRANDRLAEASAAWLGERGVGAATARSPVVELGSGFFEDLVRSIDVDQLIASATAANLEVSNLRFLGDGVSGPASFGAVLAARAVREGGSVVVRAVERSNEAARDLAMHIGRRERAAVSVSLEVAAGAFSGQREATVRRHRLLVALEGMRTAIVRSGTDADSTALAPGNGVWVPEGAAVTMQPAAELATALLIDVQPFNAASAVALVGSHPAPMALDLAELEPALHPRFLAQLPAYSGSGFRQLLESRSVPDLLEPRITGGWLVVDSHDAETDEVLVVAAAGVALAVPRSELALLEQPVLDVAEGAAASRLPRVLFESGLYSEHQDH